MKLNEALAQRADIQKRLQQLLERAKMSTTYQEGTKPVEDTNALLAEHARLSDELEKLIQRINRTNSSTQLRERGSISDAIATRDVLRLRAESLRHVADAAIPVERYGRSEILVLVSIDVPTLRKQIDALMKEHRMVDQLIQESNFTTELLD